MSAACAAPVNTAVSTKLATKRVMTTPAAGIARPNLVAAGIPIVASALPFRLACRVSSKMVGARARPRFACVETATFRFMDGTQIPNDGGKASSRGTSSLDPVAALRTCQELTHKRANRIDGFFAARADGLLRAGGAGDVKIAA